LLVDGSKTCISIFTQCRALIETASIDSDKYDYMPGLFEADDHIQLIRVFV